MIHDYDVILRILLIGLIAAPAVIVGYGFVYLPGSICLKFLESYIDRKEKLLESLIEQCKK